MILIVAIILGGICALIAEEIARYKGRSALGFGLLGFFFGPIGVVAAAVSPPDQRVLDERRLEEGLAKQCPACREVIRLDARSCRHCHHQLTNEEEAAAEAHVLQSRGDAEPRDNKLAQGIVFAAVIAMLLVLLVGMISYRPVFAAAGSTRWLDAMIGSVGIVLVGLAIFLTRWARRGTELPCDEEASSEEAAK